MVSLGPSSTIHDKNQPNYRSPNLNNLTKDIRVKTPEPDVSVPTLQCDAIISEQFFAVMSS